MINIDPMSAAVTVTLAFGFGLMLGLLIGSLHGEARGRNERERDALQYGYGRDVVGEDGEKRFRWNLSVGGVESRNTGASNVGASAATTLPSLPDQADNDGSRSSARPDRKCL